MFIFLEDYGTDIKANNNLNNFLVEDSPLSDFFKKHKVTFKPHEGHIDCIIRKLQPLEDEFRYMAEIFIILDPDWDITRVKITCNGLRFGHI